MIIYGVALLSFCMLTGLILGELLGAMIGVEANVGGVGISMIMLIALSERYRSFLNLESVSGKGITFWSAMYIPVIVAMAAQQNVIAALSGGPVAIFAGTGSVILSFIMIPFIRKLNKTE
ncbi:malonate transporter subunit MadL [candidate division KSB1 bacterium]